jgi:hypothetical protein
MCARWNPSAPSMSPLPRASGHAKGCRRGQDDPERPTRGHPKRA